MYNSVEDELWKVFTFYSIHGDANQPEIMRPANFVRFCRDSQIISRKLKPTAVELEVARMIRSPNKLFNPTFDNKSQPGITFNDFLLLLDELAVKVYSKDAPEFAVKRLLLENVLLLACRRVPTNEIYDLAHVEANKVVKETFGKCLHKIFDHYLDKADKRRNQVITAEKMQQKDLRNATNKDLTSVAASRQQILQNLKDMAKAQKDLINYKEYVQFCYDFNLKSTSLLTAIQIGEIYLNLVPLHSETKSESGMTFDLFCQSIIYMAYVAYRDADHRISVQDKVKAILLYMWKAVNDNEKTSRLVSSNRNHTLSQFAGSLNVFGSGNFSDAFLSYWMKDGFPDYVTYKDDGDQRSGFQVIKGVVSDGHQPAPQPSGQAAEKEEASSSSTKGITEEKSDQSVLQSLHGALTVKQNAPANATSTGIRRTNSVYVKHFGNAVASRTVFNYDNAPSQVWKRKGMVSMDSSQIAELFRLRPELSEYVFMEIQNVRMFDDH